MSQTTESKSFFFFGNYPWTRTSYDFYVLKRYGLYGVCNVFVPDCFSRVRIVDYPTVVLRTHGVDLHPSQNLSTPFNATAGIIVHDTVCQGRLQYQLENVFFTSIIAVVGL